MTSIPSDLAINQPVGAVGTGSSTLDQADFLKLMTAQLTTQDPFEPVDNSQMVAQMAQFSTTSGIAEMNEQLSSLTQQLAGSRLSGAASWIGKSMLVSSDIATPLRDGSYAGQIALEKPVENLTVDLVDADGNTVKTLTLGSRDAGEISFSWDGTDGNGNVLASGPLQIRASGVDSDAIATWTGIAGVSSPADGSAPGLVTALGILKPEDALKLA